jgi:glutamate synthase (NADPH/NADH) small chain
MMLGEPDSSGRRKPVTIVNSDFKVECDQIIIAIGRTPNPLLLKGSKLQHGINGNIIINELQQTSDQKIFAGGDIVRGETTVIEAMGDGKKAAYNIHKQFSGQ